MKQIFKYFTPVFFIIFLIVPTMANSQEQVISGYLRLDDSSKLYNLSGEWRFAPRDDGAFKNIDYDDEKWKRIKVPGTWYVAGYRNVEIGWYRLHLTFSREFKNKNIGIMIPWTAEAHELYFNGHFIGSRGKISRDGKVLEIDDRRNIYHIPSEIVNSEGDNIISFRISSTVDGGGFYFQEFLIGSFENVQNHFIRYFIQNTALSCIFIFIGLFQIGIFFRRRKEKDYLYLSLFSICMGVNIVTMSTIIFWIIPSFWISFIIAHLALIWNMFLLIIFFHMYFEYKTNAFIKISLIYCIVSSMVVLGFYFDNRLFKFYVLHYQYIIIVISIFFAFYSIYLILKSILEKKFGAWIIGIGMIILIIASINTVLIYSHTYSFYEFLDFGSLAFFLCITIAQAEKYRKIQMETERLNIHLQNTNVAYSRFVPIEFLKHLNRDDIINVKLGDQVERDMTILFSDIRSFTTITEKMSPEESFKFINGFLGEIGPVVRKHNGFIDKYIGDAIMALFPGKVNEALDAAIEMQRKVLFLNVDRKSDLPEIRIGIGIHTGRLILGTIGEQERMDGTVISDAVNLASRLEGLTKLYGSSIIISENILRLIDKPEQYSYRILDRVKVKGKTEAVKVIELFNGDYDQIIELKKQSRADFEKGLSLYQDKKFNEAIECFKSVLATYPNDIPSKIYIKRCDFYNEHGVPLQWDGIEELSFK